MNAVYINALMGGGIIGVAATLMMHLNGRVAGISGIVNGLFTFSAGDWVWRLCFVVGLVAGGLLMQDLWPASFVDTTGTAYPLIIVAGLLVGFGAVMGGGCTSGHGVCGISRLSIRSVVATITFITAGVITVLVKRIFWG